MMAYALEMDEALLPFAHELLADLSELGSDGDLIVEVLARLGIDSESLVVDLGCGKGAVTIAIARRFGCSVIGIDLHEGLIADARMAASALELARCRFVVGDIVELVDVVGPADAVVYAALGDVLGPLDDTVGVIRRCVRPGGLIVVNDSFISDPGVSPPGGFEEYGSLDETRDRLTAFGDALVVEAFEGDDDDPDELDDDESVDEAALVAARAKDLARRRPDLAECLDAFVRSQSDEYEYLERATRGAVWALRTTPTESV
jgi:ubiquinone/menaquinone biosynthesis C-methylase UbiE